MSSMLKALQASYLEWANHSGLHFIAPVDSGYGDIYDSLKVERAKGPRSAVVENVSGVNSAALSFKGSGSDRSAVGFSNIKKNSLRPVSIDNLLPVFATITCDIQSSRKAGACVLRIYSSHETSETGVKRDSLGRHCKEV